MKKLSILAILVLMFFVSTKSYALTKDDVLKMDVLGLKLGMPFIAAHNHLSKQGFQVSRVGDSNIDVVKNYNNNGICVAQACNALTMHYYNYKTKARANLNLTASLNGSKSYVSNISYSLKANLPIANSEKQLALQKQKIINMANNVEQKYGSSEYTEIMNNGYSGFEKSLLYMQQDELNKFKKKYDDNISRGQIIGIVKMSSTKPFLVVNANKYGMDFELGWTDLAKHYKTVYDENLKQAQDRAYEKMINSSPQKFDF